MLVAKVESCPLLSIRVGFGMSRKNASCSSLFSYLLYICFPPTRDTAPCLALSKVGLYGFDFFRHPDCTVMWSTFLLAVFLRHADLSYSSNTCSSFARSTWYHSNVVLEQFQRQR